MRRRFTGSFPAILAIFFLSGAVALLYQVAWFRRLQLVFGVSAFAMGAVVAAFMLGIAAGSRWAGRMRMARERPLIAYAILEVVIALYAVVFPWLVAGVERLYSSLYEPLAGRFLTLTTVRLALSLALLLPATFCMGATLPVLARAVARGSGAAVTRIGWLYAANTLGGVVGTLAAGFVALELLGIRGTLWAGAAVNLAIAGLSVLVARRAAEDQVTPAPAGSARAAERAVGKRASIDPGKQVRFATWVVAATGLTSMALELVWTRALLFYVHNSTYAFSAILAVYLAGLGLGAAAGAHAGRRGGTMRWMAGVLTGLSLLTLLSIAVYRNLPALAEPILGETLAPGLSGFGGQQFWIVRSWWTALAAIFVQVSAVLLPPGFGFGMVFPLALRLLEESGAEAAGSVGRLYAVNTTACVAGTLLGSFVLVPWLGTRGSLILLAWIPLLPAVRAWGLSATGRSTRVAWAAGAIALTAVVTIVAAPSGFYRDMFARRFGTVLWFSEGPADTVAVCRRPDGTAWIHFSDGRGASGTTSYKGGWLYAHLPLLLHPDPKSALVICFGTGNTLGAASRHALDRLDGVELSSEVVKASKYFRDTNHDVANNPGVNLIVEDGRNYLLGTRRRYDVITAEPPMIHTAGVVNLYSRDFYRLCSERLTDNGIMAVWLATWEIENPELRMLVRAFADVFPHASVWDSKHLGEWILIGSRSPIAVDLDALAARMSRPGLSTDLERIGVSRPEDLLALYLKGREFLDDYSRGARPVTDDRSVVDFAIPRKPRANFGLGDFTSGGFNLSGVGPNGLVSELRVRDFDGIYTDRDSAASLIANPADAEKDPRWAEIERRREAAEYETGRRLAWNLMAAAMDHIELERTPDAMRVLDRGLEIVAGPAGADLLIMKAAVLRNRGEREGAIESLRRAVVLNPTNATALRMLGELAPRE